MFHAWCLSPEDPHWWPIRHGPGCHQKSIPVRESPVFAFSRVAYTLGSAARSMYCVNIHRSLSPLDQHELHISESSTELELRRGDWDPMLTQEQIQRVEAVGDAAPHVLPPSQTFFQENSSNGTYRKRFGVDKRITYTSCSASVGRSVHTE